MAARRAAPRFRRGRWESRRRAWRRPRRHSTDRARAGEVRSARSARRRSASADLARELGLTDLQRERILAAIVAARPAVERLQEESRARFLEQQRLLDDKIVAELTADQVEKYRDFAARQRTGRGRQR
ncbi:MAG: hypothetical protein R2752_16750 [Vicinamibacterales bacterium]